MTQLVTIQEQGKSLAAMIQSPDMMSQLRMACAKTITPERLARVATTELRKNPKLLNCNPQSFLGALMQCAQVGLEPGSALGLAYIIPYGKEAQFQIGYKGLLALMWRSEMIASIQAECVYEGDHFEYANGIPPALKHVPKENRDGAAKITHAYCVIGTTTGGWVFRVMTFDEIEKVRKDHSKGNSAGSPWVTNWPEMACKTVLKRTSKRAPISAEASRSVGLDDMSDVGIAQNLGTTITVEPSGPDKEALEDGNPCSATDDAGEPCVCKGVHTQHRSETARWTDDESGE